MDSPPERPPCPAPSLPAAGGLGPRRPLGPGRTRTSGRVEAVYRLTGDTGGR